MTPWDTANLWYSPWSSGLEPNTLDFESNRSAHASMRLCGRKQCQPRSAEYRRTFIGLPEYFEPFYRR